MKYKYITLLITAIGLLALSACTEATNENYRTIFVGPVDSFCGMHSPSSPCLLYKESLNAEYSSLYYEIVGFEYQPGFIYELIVEEETLETPMAHGKTTQLRLVEVVNTFPIQLPFELTDTNWRLLSMNGQGLVKSWQGYKGQTYYKRWETTMSIGLTNGQVTGWAACNQYWTNMLWEGEQLDVTSLTSTLLECEWVDQEDIYMQSLVEVHSFKIDKGKLYLTGNDVELVFGPNDMRTYTKITQ